MTVIYKDVKTLTEIQSVTGQQTKALVMYDTSTGEATGLDVEVLINLDAEKADTTQVEALDAEKLDITNVYNGLDKTVEGFALDARQGKALDDVDKANYAKSVEMIAHDAAAPSPVIPTGTTKTYEFSSGGVCSWITGGAVTVEKGDKVEVAFTAPSTFVRTYVRNLNTYCYSAISSRGYINFNNVDKRIEITQTIYINKGNTLISILPSNISYPVAFPLSFNCLIYNLSNSTVEICGIDDLSNDKLVIATFSILSSGSQNNVYTVSSCIEARINDYSVVYDTSLIKERALNSVGIVSSRSVINFNNSAQKIELSYPIYYSNNGLENIAAGSYDIDMSSCLSSHVTLCINKNSNAFIFKDINSLTVNDIAIAGVIKNTNYTVSDIVFCLLRYTINGTNDIISIQSKIDDININLDNGVNELGGDIYTFSNSVIDRNGNVATSPGYSCTDYLPIDISDEIVIHGGQATTMQICNFYDINGSFICTYRSIVEAGGGTMTLGNDVTVIIPISSIPANAKYIRCSKHNTTGGYVKNKSITISSLLFNVKKSQDKVNSLQSQIYDISGSSNNIIKANVLESEWKSRENYLRELYHSSSELGKWYGAEWTEEQNSVVTPINSIGDSSLHTTLPIQSKMKRCVVKNGIVQYYLDDNNSELKADGSSSAVLDGTDGQVMVEIPEFFFKAESTIVNNIRTIQIKISEQGLDGFSYSPKRYTSAYEATVNRDTNELSSVCTTLFTRNNEEIFTDLNSYIVGTALSRGVQKTALRSSFSSNVTTYRGGTNDSSFDDQLSPTDSNFARNQLGIPVANLNRKQLRNLLSPKNREFIYQYDTQRILWILSMIEFKVKNIQTSSLGVGATVYPSYNAYESFFTPQRGISCIPCGVTNSLGNSSGQVFFKMQNVPIDDNMTRGDVWMPCMSYRGVEHYYGHIYKIADQINVLCEGTGVYVTGHEGSGNYEYNNVTYSYQKNPFLVSDSINNGDVLGPFNYVSGTQVIKSLLIGDNMHILPINSDTTGYSSHYGDCVEIYHRGGNNVVYPTFNGRIVSGNLCGSNFIVGSDLVDSSSSRPSDGTRLDMFL